MSNNRRPVETAAGLGAMGLGFNYKSAERGIRIGNERLRDRRLAGSRAQYGADLASADARAANRTVLAQMSGQARDANKLKSIKTEWKADRKAAGKAAGARTARIGGQHNQVARFMNKKGRFGIAAAGVIGAPLAWHGGRSYFEKADARDFDRAAAGAALGGLAYQTPGWVGKIKVPTQISLEQKQGRGPRVPKVKSRSYEQKLRTKINLADAAPIEREHMKRMGLPPDAKPGDPRYVKFYRTYPKELPGWRYRRALSYTHGGKTQMGGMAAAATLGAALNMRRGQNVAKSTNVNEYPNLPEYIREEQIPRTRRNPINPLAMYSAGLIMADSRLGHGRKIRGKARRRVGMDEYMYTGGRSMLYSPLGIGTLR